jgi:membrane-associated phospholipid phosphatase
MSDGLSESLCSLLRLRAISDYHHDFSDVNAGFMLGALSGAVAYFIYFPPLSSRYCRVPNNRKYDRFKVRLLVLRSA